MKLPGWFFLVIGLLILVQWVFFMVAGAVPEIQTAPIQLAFHLAAEFATAISLMISGIALLRNRPWGSAFGLFASGMLAYTVIASPGYFAQLGQWPLVVMFALLLVLDILCVIYLLTHRDL